MGVFLYENLRLNIFKYSLDMCLVLQVLRNSHFVFILCSLCYYLIIIVFNFGFKKKLNFIPLFINLSFPFCSNSMRSCQARPGQSQEVPHGLHLMRKTLVSALKQSFRQPSRKGKIFISYGLSEYEYSRLTLPDYMLEVKEGHW